MKEEFKVHVMRVHELLQDVVDDPEGRAYILDRKLTANEVGVGGVPVLRADGVTIEVLLEGILPLNRTR